MAEKKVLRIDTLRRRVVGTTEIDGKSFDVLQINFGTYHDLQATEHGGDALAIARETVRQVVPSIDDDTLGRLTPEDAQAILALSASGIEVVEKLYPNAVGPASNTTSPA